MSGMWTKQTHTQLAGSLKKIGTCIFFRMLLALKKEQILLFCLGGFGFNNFDPQQNLFPIMFNMFVNRFWKAKGFGYM